MSELDTERPPPSTTMPAAKLSLEEKVDSILDRFTILSDQMIGLTSAVNNNCADIREAIGTATLAGNQVRDVAERLEQVVEELRVSSELLGGVKEASGSAIDMANKAIVLGEHAVKLAAWTGNLTKQVADHLGLKLVDEDDAPNLELLRSSGR